MTQNSTSHHDFIYRGAGVLLTEEDFFDHAYEAACWQ